MAFPVIADQNESVTATAGTNHVISLPANISAGDLLIIVLDKGSTAATINAHADWTELLDENSANGLYIAYRWAAGGETNPTLVSSAATRDATVTYRITGAVNPATQAPQIGTTATGTSTAPDGPSVSPTGGAKDYLWITFFGQATEKADDDSLVTTFPTNYTLGQAEKTCGIAGANLGGMIGSAARQANTATENPGAFTSAINAAWRAQTIAIHPDPAIKVAGGTASETSTAPAGTVNKTVVGGTATATNDAPAGIVDKAVAGATAAETDVANAGITEWSPDLIAGLETWLKADAIGGADGDPVTTWEDSHTSNKDATGASGQTLQTNEINGLPVVRFDGTDDLMSVALTNNDATRTMFVVASLGATNATGDALVAWTNVAGIDGTSTGDVRYRQLHAAGGLSTIGSPGNSTPFLVAVRWNSTSSADTYFNLASATNIDPDDAYQSGANNLALASRTAAGANFGAVDIGEVLLYNSALSDTDLDLVRAYLDDKWLAGGPIVVSGGTASETDTAPAGVVDKAVSGGTATETSVANAGTVVKPIVVSGATAAETDAANAGTVVKPIVVSGGTAAETDSAQAGAVAKTVSGGTAPETDVANAGTAVKPIVVSGATASEVDTAPAGSVSSGGATTVNGATAVETDVANAGSVFKIVTGATATEASVVNAGTTVKIVLGGTASEVDVANAGRGPLQGATATELDVANAGTVSGGAQPPDTSPTLGGYFDETATGGFVVERTRSGVVVATVRGGLVQGGPRGGAHDETATGGSHDETSTGGVVH
jgi:hypothetical protein